MPFTEHDPRVSNPSTCQPSNEKRKKNGEKEGRKRHEIRRRGAIGSFSTIDSDEW